MMMDVDDVEEPELSSGDDSDGLGGGGSSSDFSPHLSSLRARARCLRSTVWTQHLSFLLAVLGTLCIGANLTGIPLYFSTSPAGPPSPGGVRPSLFISDSLWGQHWVLELSADTEISGWTPWVGNATTVHEDKSVTQSAGAETMPLLARLFVCMGVQVCLATVFGVGAAVSGGCLARPRPWETPRWCLRGMLYGALLAAVFSFGIVISLFLRPVLKTKQQEVRAGNVATCNENDCKQFAGAEGLAAWGPDAGFYLAVAATGFFIAAAVFAAMFRSKRSGSDAAFTRVAV